MHYTINEVFPQLKEGGGYELLKGNQSRMLEVIPTPPEGYTPVYLKDVIGQGKVYVRPIQKNLSLQPNVEFSVSLDLCSKFISMTALQI